MNTSKRLADIAISVTALLALAPVILVVALAIWLEDRGNPFFTQLRLGRNGRLFRVYKFRKFTDRPHQDSPTMVNDDRFSRVGRLLDKTKLNELPQLLNVLKGDMSVVGPRPETPDFKHCFVGKYAGLLDFRPGIFGPSQTVFRNEAELYPPDEEPRAFYERVLFTRKGDIDLAYYREATMASDAAWIFRSLAAVAGVKLPQDVGGEAAVPTN